MEHDIRNVFISSEYRENENKNDHFITFISDTIKKHDFVSIRDKIFCVIDFKEGKWEGIPITKEQKHPGYISDVQVYDFKSYEDDRDTKTS